MIAGSLELPYLCLLNIRTKDIQLLKVLN